MTKPVKAAAKAAPKKAKAAPKKAKRAHPFAGRYVLCRCHSAGVHAGVLQSVGGPQGDRAILAESRRLWSWKSKIGVALSGVAQSGLASGCKIDTENPLIEVGGVIEIIPCSADCERSIRGAP